MGDERWSRRWRRTAIAVTAAGVLTTGLGGCGAGTVSPGGGTTTAAAVATAPTSPTTSPTTSRTPATGWPWTGGARLEVPEFRAASAQPGTVVLDVRTPEEFAQGHLPGAVLADVNAPDFAAKVAALDPSRPYAVYCRSGNRSQVAVDALRQAGFSQVVDLTGGILAWTAAGGRTTTGP